MDWSDLWIWYNKANQQAQQEILQVVNIKELIQSLSPRYQLEVLRDAPVTIIKSVMDLLADSTKSSLGYGNSKSCHRKQVKWSGLI